MRKARRSSTKQSGAVMIWVGVSLVALLTATFLAIDVGRLYFTQRDLQRLASLSAVAGVQAASGCASAAQDGQPGDLEDVTRLVRNFLISNGGKIEYLTGVNSAPAVETGRLLRQNGLRVFEPLAERDPDISAVRVNLTRPQPRPFIGFLTGGSTLRASATAEQVINGSFNVGSTAVRLRGGLLNQTLGALVCAAGDAACRVSVVALDVASSARGLAATSISLGQLATAAGASVQDLADPVTLAAQTVVLPQMLLGLAVNLEASAAQLLRSLAAAASSNTQPFGLGEIIGDVDAGADAVPVINLLDLITALGTASHQDGASVTPIQLPLTLAVPAGVTISSYLRVLQPAQVSGSARPGAAQAQTAQVRLEIRIQADALLDLVSRAVNSLVGALGPLQAEVLPAPLNLGIDVDVAPAMAFLDAIQCPNASGNGGSPVALLSVRRALADVAVGRFNGTPTGSFSPPLLPSAAPIDLLKLSFGGNTRSLQLAFSAAAVGGSANPVEMREITEFQRLPSRSPALPPVYVALGGVAADPAAPVAANPQTSGSPLNVQLDLALRTVSSGPGGVAPPLVDVVLNAVGGLLQGLLIPVNGLAGSLIDPVLSALGIQTGAATVTLESVQIGRPQKASTCIPGGSGARACEAPG